MVKPLTDDIETLRGEAERPAPGAEEPPPADAAPPPSDDPPNELIEITTRLARVGGNIMCRRSNVALLEPEEAQSLGHAIARLLVVYNVGTMDPRTAAWLGMGIAVVGIALPRMEQAERTIEAKAEPAPAAPPPAAPAAPPKPDSPYSGAT